MKDSLVPKLQIYSMRYIRNWDKVEKLLQYFSNPYVTDFETVN